MEKRLDKKIGLKRGDTSNLDSPMLGTLEPSPIQGVEYLLKPMMKDEVLNAPIEVRMIYFFIIKETKLKQSTVTEITEYARRKYPEYFEPVLKRKM